MNSKKKTDSYNLYSCTHLSRAKINLKIDKSYAGRKKVLKYSSKPNPLLTIHSSVGQTTVFLPTSRNVLKSTNELEDNTYYYQYNKFQLSEPDSSGFTPFSNSQDNEESQMFPGETSASDEFDFSFTDANSSRYMPNILKTKSAKTKCNIIDVKTNNKKDLVIEKRSRKRKQTYNLSNIKEDGLVLNDPKENKSLKQKQKAKRSKIEENCETEKQEERENHFNLISYIAEDNLKYEEQRSEILRKWNKRIQEKRANHIEKRRKNSCARFCPFSPEPPKDKEKDKQNQSFSSEIKNSKELSIDFSNIIEKYQENPVEYQRSYGEETYRKSWLEMEDQEISTEFDRVIEKFEGMSPESQIGLEDIEEISIEALLGFENFEEFGESQPEVEDTPIPVSSEFLIPDYLDYVNSTDFVAYSDEVHKLISPSLCADKFESMPPMVVKHMLDINGNDPQLPNSNFMDPRDDYRRFISENSYNGFTHSISSQNDWEIKESHSIKSPNSPVNVPHIGVRDSLISGCGPIDFFYNKEYQEYRSSFPNANAIQDTSRFHNPHVIVEFNKFFLSCGHVECYEERELRSNCDLHTYVNDLVPVSPKNLVPYVEGKKEKNLVGHLDDKTAIPENDQGGKKAKKVEIILERFECPDCDIVFSKERTLAKHRSKAHLGYYSYSCKRCLVLFNSKIQLRRHSTRCILINKKAFGCHICQKKYSYESSLKQHLKKKHDRF